MLEEEWKWEVVRLVKLLFAVHFSYLPIYLIHFRSYLSLNCTVVKGILAAY